MRFLPVERLTAIRIVLTRHTNFRAIVCAGHTHKGEQESRRVFQPRRIPSADRKEAGSVVAVQQIEHRVIGRIGIAHQIFREKFLKTLRSHCALGKVLHCRALNTIVHHAIVLIPLKPRFRIAPELSDNQCIGIDPPNGLPKLSPEMGVHLGGYIQSPTVNTHAGPLGHGSQKIFLRLRIFRVPLGHTGRSQLFFG